QVSHTLPVAAVMAALALHDALPILDTFRQVRGLRPALLFLIAYWLYIDGVNTVMKVAIDFGYKIGVGSEHLMIALLVVQFISFRSEEHTSELQSREKLVCRLLLEKK